MDSDIAVDRLGVSYRSVEALRDITLTIRPGRLTGIIGPNGAGKSTLMEAILGLVPVTGGSVEYGGKTLAKQLAKVAYVPQRAGIDRTYPVTAWDVVMMGRVRETGWFRPFAAVSRQRAREALREVEMESLRDRPLGRLSGGQQQRVFLARSLAGEADIFCFDEPFAGVDRKTEEILFAIFHELAGRGKFVVVVNHDLGESIAHFDDLILLNKELIAAGSRGSVLTDFNLRRAYGGKVSFYDDGSRPMAAIPGQPLTSASFPV